VNELEPKNKFGSNKLNRKKFHRKKFYKLETERLIKIKSGGRK